MVSHKAAISLNVHKRLLPSNCYILLLKDKVNQ